MEKYLASLTIFLRGNAWEEVLLLLPFILGSSRRMSMDLDLISNENFSDLLDVQCSWDSSKQRLKEIKFFKDSPYCPHMFQIFGSSIGSVYEKGGWKSGFLSSICGEKENYILIVFPQFQHRLAIPVLLHPLLIASCKCSPMSEIPQGRSSSVLESFAPLVKSN